MSHKQSHKYHIDGLVALLLLGIFAVSILSVLLTGASAYRRLTERGQKTYSQRTCAQYVSTKVRQAGRPDAISVAHEQNVDMLVLPEDIGGEGYITRIYCYDGWIRELFSATDYEFYPEDGEKVLEANALSLMLEDGLLSIQITSPDGKQTSLTLALRGYEEVAS